MICLRSSLLFVTLIWLTSCSSVKPELERVGPPPTEEDTQAATPPGDRSRFLLALDRLLESGDGMSDDALTALASSEATAAASTELSENAFRQELLRWAVTAMKTANRLAEPRWERQLPPQLSVCSGVLDQASVASLSLLDALPQAQALAPALAHDVFDVYRAEPGLDATVCSRLAAYERHLAARYNQALGSVDGAVRALDRVGSAGLSWDDPSASQWTQAHQFARTLQRGLPPSFQMPICPQREIGEPLPTPSVDARATLHQALETLEAEAATLDAAALLSRANELAASLLGNDGEASFGRDVLGWSAEALSLSSALRSGEYKGELPAALANARPKLDDKLFRSLSLVVALQLAEKNLALLARRVYPEHWLAPGFDQGSCRRLNLVVASLAEAYEDVRPLAVTAEEDLAIALMLASQKAGSMTAPAIAELFDASAWANDAVVQLPMRLDEPRCPEL
ncbi:MAG: hypothetical protein RBU37_04040 [Myxococcota bacterium]|jgi:hypothetical protein|nr:hypothetical protein [Myxococcota bacterium]